MVGDLVEMEIDAAAHIARITIARPEAGNAISAGMARRITEQLATAEMDDTVKVIVIRGAGEHLSTGWDMDDAWGMYVEAPGGASGKFPSQRARLLALDEIWWGPRGLYHRLLHCRKVTIVEARGDCFDTGLYLTLCCDLAVAADDARFANPRWANVGVDGDVSLLIAAVGLKRAKDLLFCPGIAWSGQEARRFGLVDRAVPADDVRRNAEELAGMCASIMRDGIVTEKYAVFASLEKMGVGFSFAVATLLGASMSNLHYQPGEFNLLKEMRDGGADAAISRSRAPWAGQADDSDWS